MERVTLERLHSDPQLISRIHAEARRERAEMMRRILGALLAHTFNWRKRQRVAGAAPASCH